MGWGVPLAVSEEVTRTADDGEGGDGDDHGHVDSDDILGPWITISCKTAFLTETG